MVKDALTKIKEFKDWIWKNKDNSTLLMSNPPQHTFNHYASVETALDFLDQIQADLLYADEEGNTNQIMKPIYTFINTYKKRGRILPKAFEAQLYFYLDELSNCIFNLKKQVTIWKDKYYKLKDEWYAPETVHNLYIRRDKLREEYIPVAEAEDWLRRRMMTDLQDLKERMEL